MAAESNHFDFNQLDAVEAGQSRVEQVRESGSFLDGPQQPAAPTDPGVSLVIIYAIVRALR